MIDALLFFLREAESWNAGAICILFFFSYSISAFFLQKRSQETDIKKNL